MSTTITDVTELQNMNNDLAEDYILGNNIDASATSGWNSGAGFLPIGDNSTPSTGNFNGAGYTITNLFINRPTTDYVGLFGYKDGGAVHRTYLVNVDITGDDYVGGLIGYAAENSYVVGCFNYVTGSVTGDYYVGGMIGYVGDGGVIHKGISFNDVYSMATVTGDKYVGGLIGYCTGTDSELDSSYAAGAVTGNNNVGGLVGAKDHAITSSRKSFWDTETSGQASSDFGTGKTTAQMTTTHTFTSEDWDFKGVWARVDGTNSGYPYFISATTDTTGTRSHDLTGILDNKGRPVKGARVIAYRTDTSPISAVETQWTDMDGACSFTELPNGASCVYHATWGGSTNRTEKWVEDLGGAGGIAGVSGGGTGATTADVARDNLGIGTSDTPHFAGIELGHSSDTTLTRSAAGEMDVEGVTVLMEDGSIALAGSMDVNDDVFLKFGGVAKLGWETADDNANALILALPDGGATDVPLFVLGDQSILNADLGKFNGITHPTLAIFGRDATEHVRLDAINGLEIYPASDADQEIFKVYVTGNPSLAWNESFDIFIFDKGLAVTGSAYIVEQADATADIASVGQVWVHDDTPNSLYFTDDAGTDVPIVVDGAIPATSVEVSELGTASHDDLQDWINDTQSAGLIDGGAITDNGDGTVAVAAGKGMVKTTDNVLGLTQFFDWAVDSSVSLTDNSVNHIYVDYNDGITPTVNATTSTSNIDTNTQFSIGKVYRAGTALRIVSLGGQRAMNLMRRTHERFGSVWGAQRKSGMVTSSTGTRNLSITVGKFFRGLSELTTSPFDTSTSGTDDYANGAHPANKLYDADGGFASTDVGKRVHNTTDNTYAKVTVFHGSGELELDADIFVTGETYNLDWFTYWYTSDSGANWTEVAGTLAISNTQYNAIASGLSNLTSNRYGVHWVYLCESGGSINILYGVGDYTQAGAVAAEIPPNVPSALANMGIFIAKVICQEGTDTLTIYYPWTTTVGTSTATDHGGLGGLADDDHTQYFLLAGETTDAKLYSGADLILYSDAGSTEVARIKGTSGNIEGNIITLWTYVKLAEQGSPPAVGAGYGYIYADTDDHINYVTDAGGLDFHDHASRHTDGSDDIQESSTSQKGICQLDDTPVNGETNEPITSNWAFDHVATGGHSYMIWDAGVVSEELTYDARISYDLGTSTQRY